MVKFQDISCYVEIDSNLALVCCDIVSCVFDLLLQPVPLRTIDIGSHCKLVRPPCFKDQSVLKVANA